MLETEVHKELKKLPAGTIVKKLTLCYNCNMTIGTPLPKTTIVLQFHSLKTTLPQMLYFPTRAVNQTKNRLLGEKLLISTSAQLIPPRFDHTLGKCGQNTRSVHCQLDVYSHCFDSIVWFQKLRLAVW